MTLKEQAESLGITVDGRWSDKRIQEEIDKIIIDLSDKSLVTAAGGVDVGNLPSDEMNVLALRIWEGQSVSLSIRERVDRIKARLTEKGFDISNLKLPVEDKYLG